MRLYSNGLIMPASFTVETVCRIRQLYIGYIIYYVVYEVASLAECRDSTWYGTRQSGDCGRRSGDKQDECHLYNCASDSSDCRPNRLKCPFNPHFQPLYPLKHTSHAVNRQIVVENMNHLITNNQCLSAFSLQKKTIRIIENINSSI